MSIQTIHKRNGRTVATDMYRVRSLAVIGMILAAAASRLLPHPPNFAPIGAVALFGGASFASRRTAFLVPLAAMFLSDLGLGLLSGNLAHGLHPLIPWVYGSFALSVGLGSWLRRRRRFVPIAGASLAGSLIFYLVTNFGVWAQGALYARSWPGLLACYEAAIPFFGNTVLGDAAYAAVLFGGLALAERRLPILREPAAVGARSAR